MEWVVILMMFLYVFDFFEPLKERWLKKSDQAREKSPLLADLIGKVCDIQIADGLIQDCTVLALDQDWLKVSQTDKTGQTTERLIPVEDIEGVKKIRTDRSLT